MRRRSLLLSACALALGACAAPEEAAPQPIPDNLPPPPDPGVVGFDVSLYRAVAREPGNQFVSPFSVACAFALLYPGASGAAATEIAQVLGFAPSAETQAQNSRTLMHALVEQTGGSEFTLANAAWVERSMRLNEAYARTVSETLDGHIEAVDFIANQGRALRTINAWAARETHDRIPVILSQPDPARRLVLTNAVYFKGRWSDPFSASGTRDGPFYTDASTQTTARLMRQTTHARYFEGDGLQAAEFDYDQGAFALSVFLPREREGLAAFEGALSAERLDGWLAQLAGAQRQRLDVTLPKVEMNADYELSGALQAMGMRTPFSGAADFSAITADEDLMVSAVIHKTFLAIDEDGTEAAAVTAIDMVTTAAPSRPPPPPIEFKADHPFFVVLHHKPTRTRLFLGRIAEVAAV